MMILARMLAYVTLGLSTTIVLVSPANAKDVAMPTIADLPLLPDTKQQQPKVDWLLDGVSFTAGVFRNAKANEIVLCNGLISRTFRISPNGATVGFDNIVNNRSLLRSVRPEAVVEIDEQKHNVGGLTGQPIHNYLLPEWLDNMKSDETAFQCTGFSVGKTKQRFAWKKRTGWMSQDLPWPPPGVSLTLHFRKQKISVDIHYELYDGIPLLAKWFTLKNNGPSPIVLNSYKSEILAAVEPESSVEAKGFSYMPNIHVETDFAYLAMTATTGSLDKTVYWVPDPLYKTQVNYKRLTPCLLESRPLRGPQQTIATGESFHSHRTFELPNDSWDRERKGLARRRMMRVLSPWVAENPILMHVRSASTKAVKLAIDQCAQVGFEMVIMTFGSGFQIEDENPANIIRMKELADYAHAKGIALGGYSLLASRRVGGGDDVVPPPGTSPAFGNSPCLCSKWADEYFRKLYAFYEKTGMDILEHDGSYPGDECASSEHPGHKGLADSQWNQFRRIQEFYRWCRGRGIYLNVPDWYCLNGSSKTGMGYRETNWSLPRSQQEIIERQNIYDGTWEKPASYGWMFVPLVQYHGGGKAATIEPLNEHLPHYRQRLANLFGAGVQACYRGPRLYDSQETKAVVKEWTDFYRKYRKILDSDIIHVRRPDGRDIDAILHVNPKLPTKGLLMVYNPLNRRVKKTLHVNLYYTGLKSIATILEKGQTPKSLQIGPRGNAEFPIDIEPKGVTWFLVR